MIPRTREDWEHGPPIYRRRQWPFRITAMVTGFTPAVFNSVAMLVGVRVDPWIKVVVLAWLAVMIAVLATMHIRLRRRIRREFEAAAGRLCTHCAYNLKDLPPTGGCPECGHEYDAEFDARTWHGAGFEMPEQAAPPPPPLDA